MKDNSTRIILPVSNKLKVTESAWLDERDGDSLGQQGAFKSNDVIPKIIDTINRLDTAIENVPIMSRWD